MNLRAVAAALSAVTVFTIPGLTAEAPPEPLRVFFGIAQAPAGAAQGGTDALKAERDAAYSEYEKFYEAQKKKLGKNPDKWSREGRDEVQKVYEKYVIKAVDYLLLNIKPKDLEDSIRDIKNSVVGKGLAGVKEHITAAESAADAHLVLEAVARYGVSKLTVGPKYFVYLFKAGGKLKPEALAAVPHDWPKPGWFSDEPCVQFHYYRPEEPFIVFRTLHNQRWRDVMNTASACINDLAKEHGGNILAAGR